MQFFSVFDRHKDQNNFKTVFENNKVVQVRYGTPDGAESDFYKQLAQTVGYPLIYEEDPVSGAVKMNSWTEIKYDAERSSDAYKHSNKAQPLHTDYGYFSFEIFASFFYCVSQAEFGGATTFIDADTIVSILEAADPALFEKVQKKKIHFGRKDSPLANNDDYIISKDDHGWRINWNYYRAQADTENKSTVDEFRSFLDTCIEKSGELTEVKLKPGEGIFFQDRRVLHGRNSFIGNRQLNKGGICKEDPALFL